MTVDVRVLYVYAILDAPLPVDTLIGVTHEPLSLLPGPACWLAIGRIAKLTAPEPTPATLRAQDAIVRTLAARADAVLPVRFGAAFANEAALEERLARLTAASVRDALAKVRGCEQMTLRAFQSSEANAAAAEAIAAEAETPVPTGPGTAYLTQRAAALAITLPALLDPLRTALASLVRAEILDPARRAPLLGSAYHLIARGDADRYRTIIAASRVADGVTLRVRGPSPAYAFAQDALS